MKIVNGYVCYDNTYRVNVERGEDGRLVATSPDIQGFVTDAGDEKELMKNIQEVVDLFEEEGIVKRPYSIQTIFDFEPNLPDTPDSANPAD